MHSQLLLTFVLAIFVIFLYEPRRICRLFCIWGRGPKAQLIIGTFYSVVQFLVSQITFTDQNPFFWQFLLIILRVVLLAIMVLHLFLITAVCVTYVWFGLPILLMLWPEPGSERGFVEIVFLAMAIFIPILAAWYTLRLDNYPVDSVFKATVMMLGMKVLCIPALMYYNPSWLLAFWGNLSFLPMTLFSGFYLGGWLLSKFANRWLGFDQLLYRVAQSLAWVDWFIARLWPIKSAFELPTTFIEYMVSTLLFNICYADLAMLLQINDMLGLGGELCSESPSAVLFCVILMCLVVIAHLIACLRLYAHMRESEVKMPSIFLVSVFWFHYTTVRNFIWLHYAPLLHM